MTKKRRRHSPEQIIRKLDEGHRQLATGRARRRAAAISIAATTSRAFMRSSIAQPTIRFENTSLIAHTYSFPSRVRCSVMSLSQSWFGAPAVKSRRTRSSCDGVPGLVPLRLLGLPNTDHHW